MATALVVLASCAGGGRKAPVPVALPESYGVQTDQRSPLPDRWWDTFIDPDLARLITESLGDNFQIRAAWARLRGSEALARQARASWFPVVSADLGVRGQRQILRLPSFSMPGQETDLKLEQILYNASLGASYEVDLWGKLGAQRTAAALEARAAREQVEAVAITLSAQVADTYFNRLAQRAQADLLNRQLAVNEALLEAVTLRFQRGLGSAVDVLQQKQQVSAARAQLALVDAQGELLDRQLGVLTGRSGLARVGERRQLPDLPPLPATGLPSALLARRPDVRAARMAAEATDARVTAAIRNRFPALTLSGSLGYASTSPSALFESVVWSFVVGVTQTLFDGGRKAAEVDRARAAVDEQMARYADTILTALMEVETALVSERQQREHLRHLGAQLDEAAGALAQAQKSYAEGLTDFLLVLTNLIAHQRLEQSRLAADRQLIAYRIGLLRALGGSWTTALREPVRARGDS